MENVTVERVYPNRNASHDGRQTAENPGFGGVRVHDVGLFGSQETNQRPERPHVSADLDRTTQAIDLSHAIRAALCGEVIDLTRLDITGPQMSLEVIGIEPSVDNVDEDSWSSHVHAGNHLNDSDWSAGFRHSPIMPGPARMGKEPRPRMVK